MQYRLANSLEHENKKLKEQMAMLEKEIELLSACLLYTSDAADERSSVDLGGRRIIKKKTHRTRLVSCHISTQKDNRKL